jgi:uncharacterized protein YjiS (DUF1127 family)
MHPKAIAATSAAAGEIALGQAVAQMVARCAAALRRWRETRRMLAEVAALDDATLRDLGVSRWQLHDHIRFGDR